MTNDRLVDGNFPHNLPSAHLAHAHPATSMLPMYSDHQNMADSAGVSR